MNVIYIPNISNLWLLSYMFFLFNLNLKAEHAFKPIPEFFQINPEYPKHDTIKETLFIISGSFLIPSNAEFRKNQLKKLGFKNVHVKNFKDSEYYSVVVDSINYREEAIPIENRLRELKQAFFVKDLNVKYNGLENK